MDPTARPTVAIDVTPLLGARTGIGNTVAEVVHALSALDDAPDLVPYTLSFRARQHRADAPTTTRYVPIPARMLLATWGRSDVPRIDRWIKPARVLHATNYLTPPSRLPTIVSIHDCSFIRFPELCTPETRRIEPIVRRALRRGAWVHTISEYVANEVRDIFAAELDGADRVTTVTLGAPTRAASRAPLAGELAARLGSSPYVLAIGTIEPRKNYATLVAAFGEAAAEHPDLRLVIVGAPGPDSERVGHALQQLKPDIRQRVLLTGSVDERQKDALLTGATALAYPSIYEGFGLPLLEAMAASVPVVASAAGSIPEVAGDAALLVSPTDAHELATAIAEVVSNDETRNRLIARGNERVQTFSWSQTARGLADFYQRVAR
ncbi:MAG TPA: glycosyltransferase family 1 protein [Acidimicrobiia bacterium]|nr:glycosyltransferase family 1 protein [Acidimicrobiia bacterium]